MSICGYQLQQFEGKKTANYFCCCCCCFYPSRPPYPAHHLQFPIVEAEAEEWQPGLSGWLRPELNGSTIFRPVGSFHIRMVEVSYQLDLVVEVEWGWRSSIHFSSWLCIVCRGWGQAEASSTFLSICSADSASEASFSLSSSQFSCWVNFTVLFKSVESGSLGLSCKVSFSRLLFCTAWFSTLTCSHEPFQPWKFV